MKVDVLSYGRPLAEAASDALAAQDVGFDGWLVGETRHDPLQACVLAAHQTDKIDIGTGVAIAFPRSPLHVAHAAHDLQVLSQGRFVLGLGSQVRTHIEKRYGAMWAAPAPRMREYVLALRAIWQAWRTGEPLRFRGQYTSHTLMTPAFAPAPHEFGDPRVWLAAVGPRMTRACGEVADGLLCHVFTTPRYVTDVTIPALAEGAAASGRIRADLEVSVPVLVVAGRDKAARADALMAARSQIAFYGSTPAYRGVLALHGWSDAHDKLHELSIRGSWDAMAELVTDEMLDAFTVIGAPGAIAGEILRRYGGIVDRVSIVAAGPLDPADLQRIIARLHANG